MLAGGTIPRSLSTAGAVSGACALGATEAPALVLDALLGDAK